MEEATLRKWGRFYFLIVFYLFLFRKNRTVPEADGKQKARIHLN